MSEPTALEVDYRHQIAQLTKERDELQAQLEGLKANYNTQNEWLLEWKRVAEALKESQPSVLHLSHRIEKAEKERDRLAAKCAALESTCGAVLHSLRRGGMISDHSDESQLLLNAVGERRTERDAQLMLASKLQLLNRAETAEAKCELLEGRRAEMFVTMVEIQTNVELTERLSGKIQHALSDQCGEGWLSPEKVKVLVDICEQLKNHCETHPAEIIDIPDSIWVPFCKALDAFKI